MKLPFHQERDSKEPYLQILCQLLVHNHPSGDPTPSREDIEFTKLIIEGGKILHIAVIDHIIVGDDTYISLKEDGYI
jgi:DNA repair protein RadC